MQRTVPGSRGEGLADLWHCGPVAIALMLSLVLAGSSVLPPSTFTIVLVAAWAAFTATVLNRRSAPLTTGALILGIAFAGLPLLQLVPLPLLIASGLPGHGPLREAATFLQAGSWHPSALDVETTWHSFLWASGYVALFWSAAMLDWRARMWLVYVVLGVAMAGLLIGCIQLAYPDSRIYLQPDAVRGTLTGFFGNRNHQADFLVIAAGLAVALTSLDRFRLQRIALFALAGVFAAGAIATRSRAGILLLFALAGMLLLQRAATRKAALLGILVVFVPLLGLVLLTPVGHLAFERFLGEGGAFDRLLIWRESLFALEQVFPAGSGAGTFSQAYASVEALEDVSSVYINHAHSEILQVPIELGLAGSLLVIGILAGIIVQGVRLGRRGEKFAQAVLCCLAVPLLHSLVDYPLRDFALGSVACLLLAFAFSGAQEVLDTRHAARKEPPVPLFRRRRAWLAALALVLFTLSVQTGLSDILTREGRPGLALRIMPLSSRAHLARAEELLADPQSVREAGRHAEQALWLNAYSARAWALVGFSALQQGDLARADSAFLSAARLGWRDDVVQAYVFRRAVETGSPETAARSADAMLRRNLERNQPLLDEVADLVQDDGFRGELAIRLAEHPSWQSSFLARLDPKNESQASAQISLFRALSGQGVVLSGADAAQYLERVNASGNFIPLLEAWQGANGDKAGDPRQAPVDPGFHHREGSLFPFGWLPRDGKLSQVLALPAGSYNVAIALPHDSGAKGRSSPRLEVSCRMRGKGAVVQGVRAQRLEGQITLSGTITIPARRCALQILSVGPVREIR